MNVFAATLSTEVARGDIAWPVAHVRSLLGRAPCFTWASSARACSVAAEPLRAADCVMCVSSDETACIAFESEAHRTKVVDSHSALGKAFRSLLRAIEHGSDVDVEFICRALSGEVTFVAVGCNKTATQKGSNSLRWWVVTDAIGLTPIYYKYWVGNTISASTCPPASNALEWRQLPAGSFLSHNSPKEPVAWYRSFLTDKPSDADLNLSVRSLAVSSIAKLVSDRDDRTGMVLFDNAASAFMWKVVESAFAGFGGLKRIEGHTWFRSKFDVDDMCVVRFEPRDRPPSASSKTIQTIRVVAFTSEEALSVALADVTAVSMRCEIDALCMLLPVWFALRDARMRGVGRVILPHTNANQINWDNETRNIDTTAVKRLATLFGVRVTFPFLSVTLNEHIAQVHNKSLAAIEGHDPTPSHRLWGGSDGLRHALERFLDKAPNNDDHS